jgi:nitrite reductase (NADH) small subunit
MSAMTSEERAEGDLEVMLGPISAIPVGEGRTFQLGTNRIAVFRTRGEGVFATQAECPHRGGPLADGLLGGHVLVCPLHAWKFDLRTGETPGGACGVKTYPVRVDAAGRIVVRIPMRAP